MPARPEESPFPSRHVDSCTRWLIRGRQMVARLLFTLLFLSPSKLFFYFSTWKSDYEQNLSKQDRPESFRRSDGAERSVAGTGVSTGGSGQLQLCQRPCFLSFFFFFLHRQMIEMRSGTLIKCWAQRAAF